MFMPKSLRVTQEAVAARRAAVRNSKKKRDARCIEEAEMDRLMTKLKHEQSDK